MYAVTLFAFVSLFAFLRARRAGQIIDPQGRCAACAYDTRGLPDEGVCPECGTVLSFRRQRKHTELHWRCPHPRVLAACAGLVLLYAFAVWPLAEWLVVRSYRALGYSPEVSLIAATKRELAALNPDSILFPMWLALGLSPLLAYTRPKHAALVGTLCVGAAFALAIARWFPPFTRW